MPMFAMVSGGAPCSGMLFVRFSLSLDNLLPCFALYFAGLPCRVLISLHQCFTLIPKPQMQVPRAAPGRKYKYMCTCIYIYIDV